MSLQQLFHSLENLRLPDLVNTLCRETLQPDSHPYDAARHRALHLLVQDWQDVLSVAAGSSANHQAWHGGLKDHLAMMLRDAIPAYLWWRQRWQMENTAAPFNLQHVATVILLHDAEKYIKYAPIAHPQTQPYRHQHGHLVRSGQTGHEAWDAVKEQLIADWQQRYGFTLSAMERNALTHAHGESDKAHRKDARVMNELASFLHVLDNGSARIGHSHGRSLG